MSPESDFNADFSRLNGIEKEFLCWDFKNGMGFLDQLKWWGDHKKRLNPHEGVDLLYFQDRQKRTRSLENYILIPPLFEGEVVSLFPDFIGESILFRHPVLHDGLHLFSILGHVSPLAGACSGAYIKRTDAPVAFMAPVSEKCAVPAHIHLSLFYCANNCSVSTIDWAVLGSASKRRAANIILVNPLEII